MTGTSIKNKVFSKDGYGSVQAQWEQKEAVDKNFSEEEKKRAIYNINKMIENMANSHQTKPGHAHDEGMIIEPTYVRIPVGMKTGFKKNVELKDGVCKHAFSMKSFKVAPAICFSEIYLSATRNGKDIVDSDLQ